MNLILNLCLLSEMSSLDDLLPAVYDNCIQFILHVHTLPDCFLYSPPSLNLVHAFKLKLLLRRGISFRKEKTSGDLTLSNSLRSGQWRPGRSESVLTHTFLNVVNTSVTPFHCPTKTHLNFTERVSGCDGMCLLACIAVWHSFSGFARRQLLKID